MNIREKMREIIVILNCFTVVGLITWFLLDINTVNSILIIVYIFVAFLVLVAEYIITNRRDTFYINELKELEETKIIPPSISYRDYGKKRIDI